MPDQLNKQTLINLLIDSPLREPIKINLIDIVNNTSDPDLPKVFPTIVKELEIFQKATERRMKLADETIQKLGGTAPAIDTVAPVTPSPVTPPPAEPVLPPAPLSQATNLPPLSVPPIDLPPLPTVPTPPAPSPVEPPVPPMPTVPTPPISTPSDTATLPPLQSLGTTPATAGVSSDEDALAEIQKELESLKSGIATDANPAPAAAPQA